MRTTVRLLGLFARLAPIFLLATSILGQTNPPPQDPHEMVTREPLILTKPADRSVALDLLDRARENYNLHEIQAPFILKVSFETSGQSNNEGQGSMEEIRDGESRWLWSAQLGEASITRISSNGRVFGTDPSVPVPLRVQMVRSALMWPIFRNAGAMAIRAADVDRDGMKVTCLLLSASIPDNPAPRSWVEQEFCVDPVTGFLRMWSAAPGIYALYDYTGSSAFHGHTLPQEISIYEDGRLAVEARVESLEDAPNLDANLFKPAPDMSDSGEAFTLASPKRFPMRADPTDGPTSPLFQPLIVHAIIDAQDGRVLDAEPLQSSDRDLTRAALDLVRNNNFQASGFQQEVFINVQFHMPAARMDGPPIFHTPVRWIIWERRGRAPVHKARTGSPMPPIETTGRTPPTLPN